AQGVAGIKLGEGDAVVGASLIPPAPSMKGDFLTVSEKGFLKRTLLAGYPIQSRYGKGVRTAHLTDKTGNLAACALVEDGDNVSVISERGYRALIPVLKVPRQGRGTQGELLADFGTEDKVALVIVL
ncbi:MAG: DNA gyrase C-terminal beta-propeller domain-containing protein, partial [Chloroflexota bacterium]|nr:DNA gyrase C-terminal beta-propeller domain-containing protein [Chloroflexota bacterium]